MNYKKDMLLNSRMSFYALQEQWVRGVYCTVFLIVIMPMRLAALEGLTRDVLSPTQSFERGFSYERPSFEINDGCFYKSEVDQWTCSRELLESFYGKETLETKIIDETILNIEVIRDPLAPLDCIQRVRVSSKDSKVFDEIEGILFGDKDNNGRMKRITLKASPSLDSKSSLEFESANYPCLQHEIIDSSRSLKLEIRSTNNSNQNLLASLQRRIEYYPEGLANLLRKRQPPPKEYPQFPWVSSVGGVLTLSGIGLVTIPLARQGWSDGIGPYTLSGGLLTAIGVPVLFFGLTQDISRSQKRRQRNRAYDLYWATVWSEE